MRTSSLSQYERRRIWITVRYCLPLLCLLAVLVTSLVPCFRLISVQNGYYEPTSLFGWLGDRIEAMRENLRVSDGSLSDEAARFVQIELALLVTFGVLFALGVAAVVYLTVKSLDCIREPEEFGNSRVFFMTLVPNRAVFFLYQLMLMPLLLLPHLWVFLMQWYLDYPITLDMTGLQPWMIALALLITQGIVGAITRRTEQITGLDPFRRRVLSVEEPVEEEVLPTEKGAEERMAEADYIRRLLAEDENDSPTESKKDT